jgi:hypothetical protein
MRPGLREPLAMPLAALSPRPGWLGQTGKASELPNGGV